MYRNACKLRIVTNTFRNRYRQFRESQAVCSSTVYRTIQTGMFLIQWYISAANVTDHLITYEHRSWLADKDTFNCYRTCLPQSRYHYILAWRLKKWTQIVLARLINYAPRHEDVGRRGGIAPRIQDLSTIRRWATSFTPTPLYLPGRSSIA